MTYPSIPGAPIPESLKPLSHRQLSARIGAPVQPPGLTTREITAIVLGGKPKTVMQIQQPDFAWANRYVAASTPPVKVLDQRHNPADVADLMASGRRYQVTCAPHHDDEGKAVFILNGHAGVRVCQTLDEAETYMRATAALRVCGD